MLMFRNVFVFSFFRDFVMAVFDSTLDADYWIFEYNNVTTFKQDLTDGSRVEKNRPKGFFTKWSGRKPGKS